MHTQITTVINYQTDPHATKRSRAALLQLFLLQPLHLRVHLLLNRLRVPLLLTVHDVEHLLLESGALAVNRDQLVELIALQYRE